MIVNDLLVKGTGRFVDNVYASEFVGDLDGNAETSTYATYVKQNSSNASYGRPILLAYQESPVDGTASNVYYDSAVTVNPSTNTITADTFKGNLNGNAATATEATKAYTLTSSGTLTTKAAMDGFISLDGLKFAPFDCNEATGTNFAAKDGMLLSMPWTNTGAGFQIAFDDNTNADIAVRGRVSNAWSSWYHLLNSGNYTNYAADKNHTHTTIPNNLTVNGYLKSKSTQFDCYSGSIAANSGSNWYRIYTNTIGNASGQGSQIITLGRSYNSPQNEEYTFSIQVGYSGQINITQLSGVIGGHIIQKIRVVYKNSSTYYIDFYNANCAYQNTYYIHGMGYGEFQAPVLVSSIEDGYSTYEFSTVNGCKSDKGFTGDLSGNAATATALTTNAGDSNTPVYFSGGKPVACTSLDLNTTGNAATATKAYVLQGAYTSNGGAQPPSYVGANSVKCNMMNNFVGTDTSFSNYADVLMMNAYSWSDVPYATALAIQKTDGIPRAWIAAGGNTDAWSGATEIITKNNIGSQSVSSATKATQDASGNTITSTYATKTELNNKSKVQIVRW